MNTVHASPASRGLYRSLWHFAAGSRLALVAGTALLIASQLLRLVVPWLAGQAIDVLQLGGTDSALRAGCWVVALLVTSVVTWGLHGPGRVLQRAVGVRVRRGITEALMDKLTNAPLRWHDQHAASDLQQRMNQSSGALDEFAQNQYIVLQSTVTFVGTLSALVFFSPEIGVLAIVAYAILVGVGMRFDRSITRLAAQENDAQRRHASGLLEFIGGIVTVTALRLQPNARRLLGTRLEAIFVPLKRSIRLNEAKWCAVDLLTTAVTWTVVALYVWRAHGSAATVLIGGVFMVHQYAEQASAVVTAAAAHLQGFARFRVNFASAGVIWDAPKRPEIVGTVDRDWRRIELRDVGYRHETAGATDAVGTPVPAKGIDQVSIAFARGERVALVGPSGAGKSTLMRVMAGLYEASHGRLTVDGVSLLGVGPLASVTTFIPQDADVFEATVVENITMQADADRDALARALRASAFDEVLPGLSDGLATPVAERGISLSGGQRQRLCLARGVYAAADSSLILLDEPTSALDPLIESHVYRELKLVFPTSTIVASVHRMSLLEHFDRVVLMVEGRVVDSGTVAELRSRQPLFVAMLDGRVHDEEELRAAA